jgi:hypothetical protein
MENTAKINTLPTAAVPPPAPQEWVFEIAESARKAEASLQSYISENPIQSVAIALGLGFVANLIVKSVSSSRSRARTSEVQS